MKNYRLGFDIWALVLFLLVKFGLDIITRHNMTVEVPDLTNVSVEEAESIAAKGHVGVKGTDSVFIYRLPAGVVYRQNPQAGAIVKRGRKIFLISTHCPTTFYITTPKAHTVSQLDVSYPSIFK